MRMGRNGECLERAGGGNRLCCQSRSPDSAHEIQKVLPMLNNGADMLLYRRCVHAVLMADTVVEDENGRPLGASISYFDT